MHSKNPGQREIGPFVRQQKPIGEKMRNKKKDIRSSKKRENVALVSSGKRKKGSQKKKKKEVPWREVGGMKTLQGKKKGKDPSISIWTPLKKEGRFPVLQQGRISKTGKRGNFAATNNPRTNINSA